jgi:hypothetical protein
MLYRFSLNKKKGKSIELRYLINSSKIEDGSEEVDFLPSFKVKKVVEIEYKAI